MQLRAAASWFVNLVLFVTSLVKACQSEAVAVARLVRAWAASLCWVCWCSWMVALAWYPEAAEVYCCWQRRCCASKVAFELNPGLVGRVFLVPGLAIIEEYVGVEHESEGSIDNLLVGHGLVAGVSHFRTFFDLADNHFKWDVGTPRVIKLVVLASISGAVSCL
jgi:hypothetical protein